MKIEQLNSIIRNPATAPSDRQAAISQLRDLQVRTDATNLTPIELMIADLIRFAGVKDGSEITFDHLFEYGEKRNIGGIRREALFAYYDVRPHEPIAPEIQHLLGLDRRVNSDSELYQYEFRHWTRAYAGKNGENCHNCNGDPVAVEYALRQIITLTIWNPEEGPAHDFLCNLRARSDLNAFEYLVLDKFYKPTMERTK